MAHPITAHSVCGSFQKASSLSSLPSCSSSGYSAPCTPLARYKHTRPVFAVRAKSEADGAEEGETKKESLFSSVMEALDFSQVRSEKDAELLQDARSATRSGEKMSREQYGALRRKIGGTYRDFFKDSVEVDGAYVDDGWVDKTCRICKKDTSNEARSVDKMGRYAHVACMERPSRGNIFTRLFGG